MAKKNYAYINNKMLIWARSITPFTSLEEIQIRTKIKSSKIDAWEKGEEYPSVSEAKKLAKLYKVPFASFFLFEEPKIEPKPYADRRTNRDTMYQEMSYELWSEIRRIIGNRETVIDIIAYDKEDYDYQPLPLFDAVADIEYIGKTIREYLGVTLPFKNKTESNKAFYYYRSLIEKKGILVSQITDVSLDEIKGLSICYDQFPLIAINNKDYKNAKTFSLIHELAHLIRRSSSLCLIDFDERNDEEEKMCDSIAAEILMPRSIFKKMVQENTNIKNITFEEIREIANKFGVSEFSVIRRLYETDFISKKQYIHMYNECSETFEKEKLKIDENNEKGSIAIPFYRKHLNKHGYLYTKIIIDTYSKGLISYGEMRNTLSVKSVHISKMEQAVMSL